MIYIMQKKNKPKKSQKTEDPGYGQEHTECNELKHVCRQHRTKPIPAHSLL